MTVCKHEQNPNSAQRAQPSPAKAGPARPSTASRNGRSARSLVFTFKPVKQRDRFRAARFVEITLAQRSPAKLSQPQCFADFYITAGAAQESSPIFIRCEPSQKLLVFFAVVSVSNFLKPALRFLLRVGTAALQAIFNSRIVIIIFRRVQLSM